MKINCVNTGRFRFNINIEEYIGDLEKLGIEQQTPIKITLPCRWCKTLETYEIYKDRVVMTTEERRK